MNVVFLSPHYPSQQYLYCAALKGAGVRVLGIGDCRYEFLPQPCKNAMNEYYYLHSLENYEEVYRAVAFFIHKYGRIDFFSSQNEYWLPLEAKLRQDFNNSTGLLPMELDSLRSKRRVKAHFAEAGISTARFHAVRTLEEGKAFAAEVGYPLVAKPEYGTGCGNTRKICTAEELAAFYAEKPRGEAYLLEEFVPGHVITFDGITDRDGNVLFGASQNMAVPPLSMLRGNGENISYTQDPQGNPAEALGRRVVKTFCLRNLFFNLEFLRLDADKPGLGRRGDFVGMELNLRAPGGAVPDKVNYAYNVDVHKIWAESLAFNQNRTFARHSFARLVVHIERSGGIAYRYSEDDIRLLMGEYLLSEAALPQNGYGFILQAEDISQLKTQAKIILQHEDGTCLVKE